MQSRLSRERASMGCEYQRDDLDLGAVLEGAGASDCEVG